MKTKLLKTRSLAVALLILLAGLGLGLSSIRQGSTNTTAFVATVEGQHISAKIFQMYLKNGIEAMGLSDKTPEGRRQIETLKESILADLIDRALVETEARRRGVSLTATEIDALRGKRIEQMGGSEVYRAYLTEHALTDDDFLAIIRQESLGEKMQGELTKDLAVPEVEARAFYDKERANPKLESTFVEPERVRASHILVGARRHQITSGLRDKAKSQAELDRLVNEEMNRRRARAEQVLARVKAGEDFARVAAEVSDDPGTRARGGDLGSFTRNAHTAKFDDGRFHAEAGRGQPGRRDRIRLSHHQARRKKSEAREDVR